MKRRQFIRKSASALAGGVAIGGAASACSGGDNARRGAATSAGKRVVWRLASSFPRGLDTIYGGAETLAEQVEAMSGGRFTIRPYPAGELVPGLQVLDAVQQGTVQIGQTASYYYVGKNPALSFDTSMPFGLTARQQVAWLEQGGGAELLAPIFAEFGAVRFLAGGTGAQMGGWFRREVNSPEDLQGLKMRIPGLGGDVLSRLGATVQVLAGGDIYPALERGAIDATEWIGPYDDEKLGFHKVAKYYYYPGFWEPGPTLSYLVGTKAWEELPSEYKAIFKAAAHVSATTMQARYDARNPAALTRLKQAGVELRAFPDSVMSAAREKSEALMEEHASQNPGYRKILTAWKKFRDESFQWFDTAEQAYAAFAF